MHFHVCSIVLYATRLPFQVQELLMLIDQVQSEEITKPYSVVLSHDCNYYVGGARGVNSVITSSHSEGPRGREPEMSSYGYYKDRRGSYVSLNASESRKKGTGN